MPCPVEFVFSEEERKQALEEGMRRQRVNEEKGLQGRNKGPQTGQKAIDQTFFSHRMISARISDKIWVITPNQDRTCLHPPQRSIWL
jgi:hypothetical protein